MLDLKTKTVGFVGGGNMAYAVAMGIVKAGLVDPGNVLVSNRSKEKLHMFSKEGIQVTQDNIEVFSKCDIIVLAVKPQIFSVVISELKERGNHINLSQKIFVSVMGSNKIEEMEETLGKGTKIVRSMPNTPCLVGAGTIMISRGNNLTDDEYECVKVLLSSCAECFECPETLLGPASSVMGCATAYGAGKLALESDKHPEQLKDAVASPGGTTIRGLYAIEKAGFRSALMDAVNATTAKL
ncbi:pyrroline-5-carboxylate reductase 3-like isoform X2 [Styela clava]